MKKGRLKRLCYIGLTWGLAFYLAGIPPMPVHADGAVAALMRIKT